MGRLGREICTVPSISAQNRSARKKLNEPKFKSNYFTNSLELTVLICIMWKKVLTSTTPIPEEIQTSFDIGPDKMSHISFNTRDLKFIDHQNDQNDIGGHHVFWILEFWVVSRDSTHSKMTIFYKNVDFQLKYLQTQNDHEEMKTLSKKWHIFQSKSWSTSKKSSFFEKIYISLSVESRDLSHNSRNFSTWCQP